MKFLRDNTLRGIEQTLGTMDLLKIMALGTRQIEEGKVQPAKENIKRLRDRKGPH
jgi:hypothetical protein